MRRLFNHRYDQKAVTRQVRRFCKFLTESVDMVWEITDLHDWERDPTLLEYYIEKNWKVLVSYEITYDYEIIAHPFYFYDARNPELNEAVYFVGAIPGQTIFDLSSNKAVLIDEPCASHSLLTKIKSDVTGNDTYAWDSPFDIISIFDEKRETTYLSPIDGVEFDLFEFGTKKAYDWSGNTNSNRMHLENSPTVVKEMNEFLAKVNSPVITAVLFDGYQMNLSSSEFGMNFFCEWRLRKEGKIVIHSGREYLENSELEEVKRRFLSQRIIGFSLSEFFIHLEPMIHIGDGYNLELFITHYYEPWVIGFSDMVFVADGTIISENKPKSNESFINMTPGLHTENIPVKNRFIENDSLYIVHEGTNLVVSSQWRICSKEGIVTSCCPIDGENSLDFLDDIIAYRKSPNGDAQYFMKNGNVLECFSFQ